MAAEQFYPPLRIKNRTMLYGIAVNPAVVLVSISPLVTTTTPMATASPLDAVAATLERGDAVDLPTLANFSIAMAPTTEPCSLPWNCKVTQPTQGT
jgi:hypothetical protein